MVNSFNQLIINQGIVRPPAHRLSVATRTAPRFLPGVNARGFLAGHKMKKFNKELQEKFARMQKSGKLFRVELTGQQVWDLYLGSFSRENSPVFRDPASSSHNCNHCNSFIRRYGNIVSIDESFQIDTMFDVSPDEEYMNTAKVLSSAIKSSKISEVFVETITSLKSMGYESLNKITPGQKFQLGVASNVKRYTKEEAEKFGVVKEDELRTFNHLHLFLESSFVNVSGSSIEAIMGSYRDAKNVFQRGMETISLDTLNLVKDLINQGSLLDGTTHLHKIEKIIPLKTEYDALATHQRDNWCWVKSYNFPLAKFRNELIGVLCTELAEGKELNEACKAWNKRVDPANYMKAVAPITKKQIEEARKFVEENGYTESFDRRFATLDDIRISEILFANAGDGKIKSVSIFDGVKPNSTRHKRNEFDGVESVPIEKFMKDILPGCSSVEVFLTNNQEGNMVSLTTAKNSDSKPIFKWSNNYSWTFNGNLAGKSQIKEEVKSKGGKVDGVLRFSMMWADGDGDNSDLDLHCIEPNRNEIYYGRKMSDTGGNLDVDIMTPRGKLAVENITYPSLNKMPNGMYHLFIRQFSSRGSKGFKAEVEFEGTIYSYEYNKPVVGDIGIADVTLKDGKFSIKHLLPESSVSTKDIYGLETNQFHKVNLVCLSPNHWGENNTGNKHYFFMLEGCKSPSAIRSFHNENLLPELAQHRKVLEVLGATNIIESTEKQLSGVGYNSTVREELIVKLKGTHQRVIKIIF